MSYFNITGTHRWISSMLRMLVFGAILLAVAAAYFVAQKSTPTYTCDELSEPGPCRWDFITTMAHTYGTEKSLAFIHDTIFPKHGYGVVHLMMHVVGEDAFDRHHDLAAVFKYMEPYISEVENKEHLGGFDGYYHGAIIAYFLFNQKQDINTLIHRVCEEDLTLPGTATATVFACYHTIGHALLHFEDGDVMGALAICDAQVGSERRNGCYNGVFMEQSFLYYPQYHFDATRHFDVHESMAPLCATLDAQKAAYCAIFIGQSYLATHPNDVRGAFAECDRFAHLSEKCSHWVSFAVIPALAGHDMAKITEYCTLAADAYEHRCIAAARAGLQI